MEKEAKKDNGSDIEPSSIEDIALHSEKKENKVLQFKEDITMQDMFLRRTGRLNRLRYFKRSLVVAAANIIASVAIEAMFMDKWGNTNSTGEFIQVIAAILLLIPSYLLDVRRLQDINQGPALAIVGTIMSRTRRHFTSKFKSNLVIELLKGEKDLNTLAAENEILPNLLRNWKNEFLSKASIIFDDSREDNLNQKLETERKEKASYARKVGQLTMQYSNELREAVLRRLLPPQNESISKVASAEGISEQTLRNWLAKAKTDGTSASDFERPADKWSTQDKFLIVVETASMNEEALAEYARKKGLYVDQIKSWRDACLNANGGVAKEAARLHKELKATERENRKLGKELARKEKALAETAALLVLRKKADAIWGDNEDE